MFQSERVSVYFLIMIFALVSLSACSHGADFQGVPQAGAKRTKNYPVFARDPKGETTQLTAQNKEQALSELDAAKREQLNVAVPLMPTQEQLEESKRQAQQTAAETLKKIENNRNIVPKKGKN